MVVPTKAQLIKLQQRYGSDASIAAAVGASFRSVLSWRKKRDVPSIYFKNERRNQEIKVKSKEGWSVQRICQKYGLSTSQVYRILRRGR